MGKGNQAPAAPDFGPISKAAKRGGKYALKLAHGQHRWARKQAKRNRHVIKPVIKEMKHMMRDQVANAEADRERYEDTFVPLEDQLIDHSKDFRGEVDKLKQDALAYGAEPAKRFRMGQAQADVADQFEAARRNSISQLEGFGINPSATRYAALDIGVRTAQAAAEAAAGTESGLNTDETSRKMYQDALTREMQANGLDMTLANMGRSGSVAGQNWYEGAQVSGAGAVGSQLGMSGADRLNRGSVNDFLGSFNQSLGEWTGALDASSRAALGEFNADQQASSGIGGIIGGIAGLARGFFEEGGHVDEDLSPSKGIIDDDIPARLTAGEFVVPKDVVHHIGASKFNKMIASARNDMGIPEDA